MSGMQRSPGYRQKNHAIDTSSTKNNMDLCEALWEKKVSIVSQNSCKFCRQSCKFSCERVRPSLEKQHQRGKFGYVFMSLMCLQVFMAISLGHYFNGDVSHDGRPEAGNNNQLFVEHRVLLVMSNRDENSVGYRGTSGVPWKSWVWECLIERNCFTFGSTHQRGSKAHWRWSR